MRPLKDVLIGLKVRRGIVLWLVLFMFLGAQVSAEEVIGRLTHVEGRVDILLGGKLPAMPARVGDDLYTGDIVRTKSHSMAEVTFYDGNVLKIGPRSRIDISEYISDGINRAVIRLPRGKVEAVVKKETTEHIVESPEANRFEIHTPVAVAGVRGTDFIVFHNRNISGILVFEGIVEAYNPEVPEVKVRIGPGQITTITKDRPPTPPRTATETEKEIHKRGLESGQGPKTEGEGVTEEKVITGEEGITGETTSGYEIGKTTDTEQSEGSETTTSHIATPTETTSGTTTPITPPVTETSGGTGGGGTGGGGTGGGGTGGGGTGGATGTYSGNITSGVFVSQPWDTQYGGLTKYGSISGSLQGEGSLGSGTSQYSISGSYSGPTKPLWHLDIEGTSSEGGAFRAFFGGVDANGVGMGLYIGPDGTVSFLHSEDLSGNLGSSTWNGSGNLIAVPVGTSTYTPSNVIYSYKYSLDALIGGPISGVSNYIIGANSQISTITIDDQKWGLWLGECSGSYSGTIPQQNWDATMGLVTSDVGEIDGTIIGDNWSNGYLSGRVAGGFSDITSIPTTGIYLGNIYGTYDPNSSTWEALMGGIYIETTQFLSMACPQGICNTTFDGTNTSGLTQDQDTLYQLRVPFVEVGRTTLQGTNGNVSVTMSDVIFFAPSTGSPPIVWATGNVTGSYSTDPTPDPNTGAIEIPLNGGGGLVGGSFIIQTWDTTNNKWMGSIYGSGTLTGGSYSGNISIRGTGAGTIDPANNKFSGTASGTVIPGLGF